MTFKTVVPFVHYPDVTEAVNWLTDKLGFGPSKLYAQPDGTIANADVVVGTTSIMINGDKEKSESGANAHFIIPVEDVDAYHAQLVDRGVEAQEPYDTPYGPRCFIITDPWGYEWNFWQGGVTSEPVE